MLSWPPGLRDTDGIWAKHWYDAVARSTSFEPYKSREGTVPDNLGEVYTKCRQCYEELYQHRLR
jgi:Sulfotransferase domain